MTQAPLQNQSELVKNKGGFEVISKKASTILKRCQDEIICSICWKSMSQCVTVAPCMHNFCNSCFSEYLKSQYWNAVCPICKLEIQSWKKNLLLNTLIGCINELNSELLQAFEKVKEMMDEKGVLKFQEPKLKGYKDGVYFGILKDGKREGKGKFTNLNQNVYDGEWKNDKRKGYGEMIYHDGARYKGEWENDQKNGFGESADVNGVEYKGEFKDDKAEGKGELKANGSTFKGEFKDNRAHGFGEQRFADGSQYRGEYMDGQREGQGEMIYTNGDRFLGRWKSGTKNGHGELTYANGERYKGDFKDGEREGYGKYYYVNGDKFQGEWKNDKKNGFGEFIKADGTRDVGKWKDDQFSEPAQVKNEGGEPEKGNSDEMKKSMKKGFFKRVFPSNRGKQTVVQDLL